MGTLPVIFVVTSFECETLTNFFRRANGGSLWKPKTKKQKKLPESFCKFFQQLNNVPSLLSSIEQVFSILGILKNLVQNFKRIRLISGVSTAGCNCHTWGGGSQQKFLACRDIRFFTCGVIGGI